MKTITVVFKSTPLDDIVMLF